MKERYCLRCGKKFQTEGRGSYCSDFCRVNEERICEICGSKFYTKYNSSGTTCSKECGIKKKQNTCLRKYGVVSVSQNSIIKSTKRKTRENHTYTKVCKRCGKEFITNDSRAWYCSDYCKNYETYTCTICGKVFERRVQSFRTTCSGDCQKKLAEITNIEKYGNKNGKGYGTEYHKNYMIDKYGVDSFFKLENFDEIRKQRCIEKYGVDHYMKKASHIETIRQNNMLKFGATDVMKISEFKERNRKTLYEHYGVTSPAKDRGILTKMQNTCLERYGVNNPTKSKEILDKVVATNLERYGVPYFTLTDVYQNSGATVSKKNKALGEVFKINEDDYEFKIGAYSYDLKKDETLIEINPSITHNSTYGFAYLIKKSDSNDPLNKNYHINKTKFALDNGYRCIQIFDWDDVDKIKYLIKDKETLYARNLTLKDVSKDECDNFLNNNHLQSTCKGQDIRLGLYKDDKLVQLMTFGTPRYNKKFQYELLRLCTDKDYKVVGGSNKLFKYFIDSYNPLSIISYCDNSKFSGDVYKSLNFTLKTFGTPSCHWFNLKTGRHITDNLLRARGFSQLHGDNNYEIASKGDSNKELMIKNGYVEVYDCGQSTYVWYKES